MNYSLQFAALAVAGALLTACSPTAGPQAVNVRSVDKTQAKYENPFQPNTYAHFIAGKDYPSTYGTYANNELLELKDPKKQRVVICLDEQRGRYYVNDEVAMDFPVSTGVKSYPTKTGDYTIIGKKTDHVSNLYGKMYDADNKLVNGDANSTDEVPEGGRFTGSPMPYWMRLTNAGLGMHVGKVGRRPLSHGCIRLQKATAEKLYARLPVGTPVKVQHTPEEYKAVPVKDIAKPQ